MAYSIASLLNNLFGKGKEPFWQQAYTNLVKFIILLHKVAYDYVTLFDVYECAISPDVLENRFTTPSAAWKSATSCSSHPSTFRSHVTDLNLFDFAFDPGSQMYRTKETPGRAPLSRAPVSSSLSA